MSNKEFDEFFEDVQKDIRAERFKRIWKKYGKIASTCATCIFILTAGYVLWSQHLERQNQEQALQFTTTQNLIAQGRIAEALSVLSTMTQHKTTYGILAKFMQANHNKKDSLKIYKELTTTGKTVFFKDLARILYVIKQCEKLKPETIHSLKEFIEPSLKGPWSLIALDLKGFLLYQQKNYKEASDCFVHLAQDTRCPENLKLRAQIFAQSCAQRMAQK